MNGTEKFSFWFFIIILLLLHNVADLISILCISKTTTKQKKKKFSSFFVVVDGNVIEKKIEMIAVYTQFRGKHTKAEEKTHKRFEMMINKHRYRYKVASSITNKSTRQMNS